MGPLAANAARHAITAMTSVRRDFTGTSLPQVRGLFWDVPGPGQH